MKIILTVTNDLNHDQRMIRMATALQEAGHDCLLVGRKLPESAPAENMPFRQHRFNLLFVKGKAFYLEYNLRLFFWLLLQPLDLIWAVDCDTALPARWVSAIRGKKWVFDAHELFTHVPEVQHRKSVQRVWEYVQRMAFTKSHMQVTVGEALAAYFDERYGSRTVVVRNAPELSKAVSPQPDKDRFMLYQGALNAGRGLENLIMAMKEIPCRLVLAGEGDLSESLRKLTDELGLADKVTFLGRVLPADLPALTSRAWIGFNVSENAGLSYYLSLNNKFFDYVHAGLPSLINPFPEYEKLCSAFEVGLLTRPEAGDIAKNACRLLGDEVLHHHLKLQCLAAREKWNWENEKRHFLSIFETAFSHE